MRPPRKRRRYLSLCATACLVSLLAGCTVGPDYRMPPTDLPGSWAGPGGSSSTRPATQPSVATTRPVAVVEWWTLFNDPHLTSLVGRALESNLDLRSATARIRQARAARGGAVAGLFPTVDVSGSYRRSGSGGGDDSTVVGGSSGARSLFQAGLDAAWEIDVFGGIRRGVEAADADIRAAVEDRRDVLITLASEVALNYLDLRGLQRQLVTSRRNLEAQRRTAALTRERRRGEFVSGLDVANADAQVATTESQLPALETAARQAMYNLAVLLGQEPGALVDELAPREEDVKVPPTPGEVPMGLPSDLLRRRPDIRRADADLHSATARIGVATADLFPRFSLTGSFGTQGEKASSLFNWDNRSWSFGPSVSWPLFDAGRIRSNIAVQNAIQEQALLAYRSVILTALRDVESALVAYDKEQQRRTLLADAVAANRRAVELSTTLYTQGLTDFINVLNAQRSLFASEDALVRSDVAVAQNLVALYKALGGGWESAP